MPPDTPNMSGVMVKVLVLFAYVVTFPAHRAVCSVFCLLAFSGGNYVIFQMTMPAVLFSSEIIAVSVLNLRL